MSTRDEIARLQRKLDYRTAAIDILAERLGEASSENHQLKLMLQDERDRSARLQVEVETCARLLRAKGEPLSVEERR